jgi:hypothetical protein
MRDMELRPIQVQAVHPPWLDHVVEQLTTSMRAEGWRGRPLLVEEEDQSLSVIRYVAWTGSHRIAAAIKAELKTSPCR